MAFETVFKRYELKYLITRTQKDRLLEAIKEYTEPDKYGKTVVRNIYFDTESYRLIRRSLEKPVYKEKFRIRSYKKADSDTVVFAELKKKYKHVVYKRRLALSEKEALSWLYDRTSCPKKCQVADEIDYFFGFYGKLVPVAFISYEREAFYGKEDKSFRITFDTDILFRDDRLTLEEDAGGLPLLSDDTVLAEIKCAGAVPLWLTQFLSAEKIYRTSFSKYGTAYKNYILPEILKERNR